MQRTLPRDYFEFFGLERKLGLDSGKLQQQFYALSRQYHPDRFMRASAAEREYALEATALLNDAYRVLRDPVARAEYVVKTELGEPEPANSNAVPPELLEEVFELNEALAEGSGIEQARARVIELRDAAERELQSLFAAYDAGDREALMKIRTVLNRRKYIANLLAR